MWAADWKNTSYWLDDMPQVSGVRLPATPPTGDHPSKLELESARRNKRESPLPSTLPPDTMQTLLFFKD